MEVKCWHRWNTLDKRDEFCIKTFNDAPWDLWFWFYLGRKLEYPHCKYRLLAAYPWSKNLKLIKTSTNRSAKKAAATIARAIERVMK